MTEQHVTIVRNVDTGEQRSYTLDPRQAVIAAYAQSLGDWNTWDYARYAPMVVVLDNHLGTRYLLGSFWAR
jgi:hypothetical protein